MTDLASMLVDQEERLSHCVHCGFCLPVCPTYVRLRDENDSPRGRLHLMRAVAGGRLLTEDETFGVHIDRCLGCRACETVCPSGVEYGVLLEKAREDIVRKKGQAWVVKMLLGAFASPGMRRVSLGLARVLRASRIPVILAKLLPDSPWLRAPRLGLAMLATTGGPGTRALPVLNEPRRPASPTAPGSRGRVGMLTGCVQEGLFRRVNEATRRVLTVNGWEVVDVPGQGCCGALHAHSGELAGARALARENVEAFGRLDLDFVVVNAAGCGAAMKEFGELLAEDQTWGGRAGAVAERVRDFNELLAETGVVQGGSIPEKVTVDRPCHLVHAQRVGSQPEDVLRVGVPDLEIIPLEGADECCGGAGIYGITHPDLGGRIGADKVSAIIATGARMALSANPGCMMQIGAELLLRGSQIGVLHPAELLDESYRRAGFYQD